MMKIAEQFFVLNPIIEQYEKKYILGINKEAKSIFQELCTRRVYIDGFIDNQNIGMRCFHKPVYAMEELDSVRENAILLLPDTHDELEDYNVCTQICILNPKLHRKKVMIYGAGIVGEKAFSILQNQGIEVTGFIDSDKSKVGTSLLGQMIYSNEILQSLTDDIVIVECGKRYREIEEIVKHLRGDLMRFYLDDELPFELSDIWVDKEWHRQMEIWPITQLGEYYEHEEIKEIILYGNNLTLARKYAEVLECMDFSPVLFMADQADENNNVFLIDEIIYRENYLLLWYEEERDCIVNKLTELGVERRYYSKIISTCHWYAPNIHTNIACLDVNLGYTYIMNFKYPGIYIYGENRENDYRIAVLGGSTTESTLDSHIRPWVEILYKQYCSNGITIFNGGLSGYNSAQELLKLIRDMLKLRPRMVIVYDGFNDVAKKGGPDFQYLENLVNYAGKHMPEPWQFQFGEKAVWRGVPSVGLPIDNWLKNINYMYALSRSENIDFFTFMQPMIYTKKNLDPHSKTILLNSPGFHNNEFMHCVQQYKEKAKDIEKHYSYIYDFTHIFDDDDVYMDICHVYEPGNRIIAQNIWNVIRSCVECK